jgi:O-antigen ligase/tetratricopeptide (TPR) repeat protein
VLNLRFTQTTAKGVAVKSLIFGGGAALAMLTLAFSLGVRPKTGEEESASDTMVVEPSATEDEPGPGTKAKRHVPLLASAQLMMLGFGLLALASPLWSDAPEFALGGAILLAVQLMWAFGLGLGLNRVAARWASYVLIVACSLTAILAIAYHGERNPTLRVSHPIGNPLFLAACLIPGILASLGAAAASLEILVRRRAAVLVVPVVLCLAAAAVMVYAFHLTESRGPLLGLLVGLGALIFFALRKWGRVVVAVAVAVAVTIAGFYFLSQRDQFSPTGRSATIRSRLFAWSYALDLAVEAPLFGHGVGGFVLAGDTKVTPEDVLADPEALQARLAHAHSEWLELWCELGSVGLVLVAGALALTFWAGTSALNRMPSPGLRWALVALLAALAGLVVEEATNVALRFPGLPAFYFTVIGLIWAMSGPAQQQWLIRLRSVTLSRLACFVLALAMAGAAAVSAVTDFRGARAAFAVGKSLDDLEWARALRLAEVARKSRLDPANRLAAAQGICGTYLHIAQQYRATSLRQAGEALNAEPPDQRLLALAEQSREQAIQHVQAGLGELGALLKISPAAWNSGFWEQGFYRVLADFAAIAGNVEEQDSHLAAAVAAMDREIARRPFDPRLALYYAGAQGRRVDLVKVLDVLARPLRHNATPAEYIELLTELGSTPDFDSAFAQVHQLFSMVTPELPVDQWPDPWAPEKRRLAAVILLTRDRPDGAVIELAAAAALYDLIYEHAPLGAAACYAELAEARYFARIDDPAEAIDTARKAIERAPDSEPGRALIRGLRNRIVTYELGAGNEEAARKLLSDLYPDVTQQVVLAELGARYSRMAHGAVGLAPENPPRKLAGWVERALELNPAYEMALEEPESVQVLDRALQLGADMRIVLGFVEQVLAQRPESDLFFALRKQLRDALGLPDQPLPATQPAVPLPLDTLPNEGSR